MVLIRADPVTLCNHRFVHHDCALCIPDLSQNVQEGGTHTGRSCAEMSCFGHALSGADTQYVSYICAGTFLQCEVRVGQMSGALITCVHNSAHRQAHTHTHTEANTHRQTQ